MKNAYEVTVQCTREVHTLPGIWTAEALRQLLAMADFDDAHVIEESELLEMVLMALQDLGNQAFPNRYGTPDAQQVRFSVRALADDGVRQLAAAAPAWIVRLLASGMDEADILRRLYEDELAGGPFKDAPGIIWHCDAIQRGDGESTRGFELIASRQWLGSLKAGQSFVANTPG